MRFKSFQQMLVLMFAALGLMSLAGCGGGSSGPDTAQAAKTAVVVGMVTLQSAAKAASPWPRSPIPSTCASSVPTR